MNLTLSIVVIYTFNHFNHRNNVTSFGCDNLDNATALPPDNYYIPPFCPYYILFQHKPMCSLSGMLRRWDDSQRFLTDMPQLICEETANYLILWCMRLQQEGVMH